MVRRACLLLLLSGCGVLLSVDEADERPSPKPVADAAAAAPAGEAPAPTDDGGADGAIDDGLIDCLGARRQAFFCDDFESTPAGSAPQPPWVSEVVPSNDSQLLVVNRKPALGAQSLKAGVGGGILLTGKRLAKVRWQRPNAPGPLALQFRINVAPGVVLESWDNRDEVVVATIRPPGGGKPVVVTFVAGGDSKGRFVLRYEGTDLRDVSLGDTTVNQWRCIQLVTDERGVTAYVDGSPKGTLSGTTAAESVELGMVTSVKNKEMFFDEVILSPSLVADCTP